MRVLHRPSYYVGAPVGFQPAPCHQWLIDTCAEAVIPDPQYFDQVRALSPDKPKCLAYNSGTDDYTYVLNADGTKTPHPDGLRVKAAADLLGVPLETMYLHWAEDTTVTFWISGAGPSPYLYPAGSRIEMYRGAHQSGGSIRELCSFMLAARPVQTKAMLQVAEALSPGGHKWDGLLLDNCGSVLYNWGDPLVSGGTVLECGQKIGTPAFQGWYWTNLRTWLVEFRAAMHALNPLRLVAMNTSNSWLNEYCTLPTADRFYQEFVGNPIRDSWPDLEEIGRRHRLAQLNGVGLWMSCNPALGNPNETWAEMQYAALCLYLAVQEPLSSTHIQDWTGPYSPIPADPTWWPKRVVSPVEANHQFTLLGDPTEKLQLLETRGPTTRQQHLYRRMYERGAVYVRNIEPYNGLTTETWDVPVGPQMLVIDANGITQRATSVSVKNGGGALLVRA
jgi:hypothetical protein